MDKSPKGKKMCLFKEKNPCPIQERSFENLYFLKDEAVYFH